MHEKSKNAGQKSSPRISGQTLFLGAAIMVSFLLVGYMVMFDGSNGSAQTAASQLTLADIPFNGERAYGYLKQLCDLGRRPSGSKGMAAQQKLLIEHFEKLGGKVELQKFSVRHPLNKTMVPMTNIIVRWQPEKTERILLCTHYDTLPYPMLDKQNPRGTFVGANDGASGTALLMELAHDMGDLDIKYGVDFVLFDGEEFIFDPDGRYFIGSDHFARAYLKNRSKMRYRCGVLLDMVGDADLKILQEGYSMSWRDTRPLVIDIWSKARELGVREFVPRTGTKIRDDHLPLRNTAKIPCCDIIDFDYPPWHTEADTPDKCSALSLSKVGWVVHEWLKSVK
jgi:glutaminyl-peptide cyclotransferase